MTEGQLSTTLSVPLSDVTFHTVMDTGFFGLFRMTPEMHTHPYYEIQAVVSGAYSIEFLQQSGDEPRTISMEDDTLCLIPPSCYHGTQALSEKPEKLALRFACEPGESRMLSAPLYPSFQAALGRVTAPRILHSAELCRLMVQIHKELASPRLGAEVMTQLYIGQFYLELLRLLHFYSYEKTTGKQTAQDSDNLRYSKLEWYFGDHFAEPITEADLAAALELSKRQTSRILQQIYGMSFREKLVSIRMSNAARLLVSTDLSIQQIAKSVGYDSEAGFYLAFRKQYGMSGTAYRKQALLKDMTE